MIKFIDLFSGIGGIRIPFDELKYTCVFSSEIDKYARKTYEENFGDYPHGDILDISPKDIPRHNLLLAGFPCQPFSIAGKRLGFEDARGNLFFKIMDIVNYHKPKAILLENVKGLKNHDGGNTFNQIIEMIEGAGYSVSYKILNSKNFGVPQNRERIYIVAIKGKNKHFDFPMPKKGKQITVGDILEKRVDKKYTLSDKLWEGHQRRREKHKVKGNGFGYSLFDSKSKYTSTVSARYYKDGSEVLIKQRAKNPRKITPREGLRLQGFPDSFRIVVSDTQMYRQIGNSVSVPVIRAIAKELEKFLK